MRGLFWIGIVLFVIVAGVYGAGSALPENIVTVRIAQYRTHIDKVWGAIHDYKNLPEWNSYIASARQLPNPGSDKPLWHLEASSGMNMVVEVTASASNVLHHVDIVENDLPFTAKWEFEFMEKDGGTLLKLRETSQIENPFVRFFRYYVVGIDKGMRVYMNELADHFVEKIEIKEATL